MAAERNSFPRRWDPCIIGFDLKIIWEMSDYVSLSKIFPTGKCSSVIPNFEAMISHFTGGEITEYKIQDDQGELIEVITTLINKEGDQWVTIVLRRDTKVIFCLYASGIGHGSVDRRTIK